LSTVLIIEDNALNRELLAGVLEPIGCRVVAAGSAEQGLAAARAERPDLVLLDMRLPGMSGDDAIAVIRQDPLLASIRVIAITAQAMQGDEARALAQGFDAYLSKPIDNHHLRTLVCRFLDQDTP
jgi:two-component system cell cycle response regulator DivK